MNAELKMFAGNNIDFYVAFEEYYNCKNNDATPSIPLTEMAEKINKGFLAEVERFSGKSREVLSTAWASNRDVQWACFAIIDQIINSLLPNYATNALNPFVDMRTTSYGDAVHFKVGARRLFTVTKGAHGERSVARQRNYRGDILVAPEEHLVTVYADLYRVLAGKEDIAEFVRTAVLSITRAMDIDALAALNDGLASGTYPSAFIETGAFKQDTLLELAQRLQAYNQGMKPIIMGTQAALAKILPDSVAGYRMNVNGDKGSVNVLANFFTYPLYELTQIPTGDADFGVELDNSTLYLVCPGADKVVKGAISTSMTNSNQPFDNADLTQNLTIRKDWKFTFASAAYAGKYTITE